MADLLWQAVSNGDIKLPSGKTMEVAPQDWLDVVQFLYKHIDGPPVQKIAPTDPTGENPYMGVEVNELIDLARKVAKVDDAGDTND